MGPAGDPVRLDVIRMPVEAIRVVGNDHVGRDLADDRRQRGRGLVQVRLPEAARVVVVRQAHHPRVPPAPGFAEEPVVGHPERLARPCQLADAVFAELVGKQVLERRRDHLPELT